MNARFACVVLAAAFAAACGAREGFQPTVAGGDARRGERAIARLQCGACHEIPGVPAARGTTGPSLAQFRRRAYVAGRFPNVPDVLVRWVRNAPALDPDTAMPDVGASEAQARDIAAYLYTLE